MGLKKFLKKHGIEVTETDAGIYLRSVGVTVVRGGRKSGKTSKAQKILSKTVLHHGARKPGPFDEIFPDPPTGERVISSIPPEPPYIHWGIESTPEEDSVAPPVKRGTLIGLGGLLRHGKDAVADVLVEKYGFQKYGMSDPLNEALLVLNPWILNDGSWVRYKVFHEDLGYVEAKKNPEVRRLLQMLGTDVGRKMIDPDIWVKIARERIEKDLSEGKNVAITAIRFPNELDMVKELGGELVWVKRPGKEFAPSKDAHASETSVRADQFPVGITNNGTLEQLATAVDHVLAFIKEGGTPKGYIGGNDYIYAADPKKGIVTYQEGQPIRMDNGKVSMYVNPGDRIHGLTSQQLDPRPSGIHLRN